MSPVTPDDTERYGDRVAEVVVLRPGRSSLPEPLRRVGSAALGLASLVGADADGRLPWPVDAAVGAGAVAVEAGARGAALLGRVASPVLDLALRPPLLPQAWTPATALSRLAARGRAERGAGERELGRVLDVAVPGVLDIVLDRIDLTAVVLARVDLERVITAALDDIDLDDIVLTRVDLERIVTAALDALTLTDVVLDRVDLERIVTAALEQLDLTEVVLTQVDLERIVTTALDGLDLTEVVLTRVDLGRVVDGALDHVDLNSVVRDRVDLPGIAEEVIDEIDLPEIIRESTGGVTTEAVRGVRMQSIDADERINRIVDRILLRRKGRRTDAPGEPESLDDDADSDGGGGEGSGSRTAGTP